MVKTQLGILSVWGLWAKPCQLGPCLGVVGVKKSQVMNFLHDSDEKKALSGETLRSLCQLEINIEWEHDITQPLLHSHRVPLHPDRDHLGAEDRSPAFSHDPVRCLWTLTSGNYPR